MGFPDAMGFHRESLFVSSEYRETPKYVEIKLQSSLIKAHNSEKEKDTAILSGIFDFAKKEHHELPDRMILRMSFK